VLTIEKFFGEQAESRQLYDALLGLLVQIGPAECKVTKSQIAFRRKKPFAWIWMPGQYLRGKVAPLVLSLSFPSHDPSPRWKEIVEPARGRFMHHLELYSLEDVDDQVNEWLRRAWELAG
jgi:hypothetical protein